VTLAGLDRTVNYSCLFPNFFVVSRATLIVVADSLFFNELGLAATKIKEFPRVCIACTLT
jgi:hypothetical protein